jgi:enamine deaminase RidA (YjgF/YER057c/UK114 family)
MKAHTLLLAAAVMAGGIGAACTAEYLTSDFPKSRGYSPAVITKGGRTIWLAGEGGNKDATGNDISGNIEAQTKLAFDNIAQSLKIAGGSLDNIVKMTVFIKNVEDGSKFVALRKNFFPSGNYPASSLITIKDLAQPGWVIEIEAVAVIGDS